MAREDCTDAQDNDADGQRDCGDSDCVGTMNCAAEVCDNDLDDDDDGAFDCADSDCIDFARCNEVPPPPASVAPAPNLSVATAYASSLDFLYTGNAPIQKGVASGALAPKRASLVSGFVADADGQPLPAVRIAVLDHPDLGWTNTRADGKFDFVVNGGGRLVVTLSLPGYLTAQRQIETDWNAPSVVPDVRLMQVDPVASMVDLSGTVGMQSARGSTAVDADGARTGTLLFPSGVQASLVDRDGQPVPSQSMPEIAVRITEYTVGPNGPQRMPAELPPNSAYTYAMELSIDGLQSAEFSQPLPYYLENFLGFPVGTSLPLGYYDPRLGRWTAMDSGVVVKLIGLNGPLADLDLDGDDVADDAMALASYGITTEERAQLPMLYATGATLWRVQVTHFSSYDINQGTVPDPDAEFPDAEDDSQEPPTGPKPDCSETGSRIGCQDQTLGEEVAVAGTPYALHYNSALVPGGNHTVKVKLGSRDRLDAPCSDS